MAYDIFISYRRVDKENRTSGTNIARTIKQQLEIEGYKDRVFFDYSELNDDEFETVILSAIEECKVFILVLTKDSMMRCVNEGDWVRREILHARKCGLKIIPIEPDTLFNGYPENFPAELDVIKRIQHTTIHMDSSFERDMRAMIESRIAPTLLQHSSGAMAMTGALVRVDTDLECKVLRYGEYIATLGKGMSDIRLPKGKHKLSFIGVESDAERYDCMVDIRDLEYEEYVEVKLFDKYNARKAEEKRLAEEKARQEAEAKRLEEDRERKEIEAKRLAEEKARQEAEAKRLKEEKRFYRLCGKGRNGVYRVGDYYDDGRNRGVVFDVSADGKHGKIVSLQQAQLPWAADKNFGTLFNRDNPCKKEVGADNRSDGMPNMQIVKSLDLWREKYPAFAWCAELGDDWYLPAIDELKLLINTTVYGAVDRVLKDVGLPRFNNDGGFAWFWSSTEVYEFCAWVVGMYDGYTGGNFKNRNYYVRAVSAF